MTPLLDSATTATEAKHDGAYRGRRLSWREFFALRPDLVRQAVNDNQCPTQSAATAARYDTASIK